MKKGIRNLVIVTSALFATILIHKKYEEYQLCRSMKRMKTTLEKKKLEQPEKSYITLDCIPKDSETNTDDISDVKEIREVEVSDAIFDNHSGKKKYYTLPLHRAN